MSTLVVPVGDPAGIGPEVSVAASLRFMDAHSIVLVGSAEQLVPMCPPETVVGGFEDARPGRLVVVDMGSVSRATRSLARASAEAGESALRALDAATERVMRDPKAVLVTGPVSKEAIVLSGVPFTGQTEFVAQKAGLRPDDVSMLFLGPRLNTALATTHLGVRELSAAVTHARVERAIRHLSGALRRLGIASPHVLVTGLNPHAGEGGLFGTEDLDVIAPAVASARASENAHGLSLRVEGPLPAEAAYRAAADKRCDGVVAMFHDQATIASKLLDWGHAVNVTWGLPFVRTSVDHGVAYDIAGTGVASAEGMIAAMELATRFGAQR